MKIELLSPGSWGKNNPLQDIFEEYQRRIHHLGWEMHLREPPRRIRSEVQWMQDSSAHADIIIALDERGKSLSSEDFARELQNFQNRSCSTLAILMGGAQGLDPSIRDGSDMVLSFGRATWPHLLVRVMAVEQIYRSLSILKNHPYHRGNE